jgi:hypothetical protein
MAYPLWNTLEVPQKIIKKIIIRSSNHLFEFMSKGDKTRMFQEMSIISYPLLHRTQQSR